MPKKIPMVISNNITNFAPKSIPTPIPKSNSNAGGFKSNMIKRIQYARAGCGSCGG